MTEQLPVIDNGGERLERATEALTPSEKVKGQVVDRLRGDMDWAKEGFDTFSGTPANFSKLPTAEQQQLREQKFKWETYTKATEALSVIEGMQPELVTFFFEKSGDKSVTELVETIGYYFPRSGEGVEWSLQETEKAIGLAYDSDARPLKPDCALKVLLNPDKYSVHDVPGGKEGQKILMVTKDQAE